MTRPAPARRPVARGRRTPGGRTTLGVLVTLALVTTAGAPSLITVRPGDTLWELARTHGTTEQAIRALNDLPGNGTIYAGSTLRISGGSGEAQAGGTSGRRHRIAAGETLSHLALKYGVSASAIASANGVEGGRIYAGRTLTIPGGGGGSASTADVPTTNAGVRIPEAVRSSVAENRSVLANRSHPSKAEVRAMVAQTARRYGVSPSLAVAVAYHESGFQQRVVSGVNAIGVMQVLPSTGRVLSQQYDQSLDLLDTQDNITAGVLLLRQLIRSEGTADAALAGYYQGLGSISRKGILPQTRDYIRSITVLRERFADG
jgi:N-acetylmuramoyl-L-alanine amidase